MARQQRGWMRTGVFTAVFLAAALGFFFIVFSSENSGNTFTGAAIGILNSGNGSQCGGINQSTTLTSNVNSSGTCFVINASNIVLDCRGFEINYSVYYGINNSGFDNVTVRNCVIKEGTDVAVSKHAIIFDSDAENGTIYNNTIILIGDTNAGIRLDNANRTNISSNSISAIGVNSAGMSISSTSFSSFYSNNITTNGTSGEGIQIYIAGNENSFTSNRVNARAGYPLSLAENTFDNIFLNNTFISETNYSIWDETTTTLFNQLIYNNSLGEIYWNLSNLTTDLNLTPGETIFVQNNNIGILEDSTLLRLNDTARLRFFNLSYSSSVPTLLRNAVQCDNAATCNRSYVISTGILSGNVSTFSGNYSTEGCGVLNGNKNLRANVTVNGTCFTVNSNNVILNCAGYQINFSYDASQGQGVNVDTFDNVTIQNCIILEGTSATNTKNGIQYQTGAMNGTIYNNTITMTGIFANAISISASNATNISANTIFIRGNSNGMTLSNSYSNNIYFNTILVSGAGGNAASGMTLTAPSPSHTILANNITIEGAGTGIFFSTTGSYEGIILYNNTIFAASGYTITDYGISTENRTLIYEGNLGTLNWTSGNLTTNLSLIVGTTIFIENNTLGVIDSRQMLELNRSAKIIMRGLTYSSTPQLLKAGTRCDGTIACNITYDNINGVLSANVSSFSNYTTQNSTTAPTLTIVAPAANQNYSFSTGNMTFHIRPRSDNTINATIYSFDNTTGTNFNVTATNVSGEWSASYNVSSLAEGSHIITILVNDSQGNYNRTENFTFIVDYTPPNVTTFTLNNFTDFVNLSLGLSSDFTSLNASVNDSFTTVQAVFFEINSTNGTRFNVSASRFAGRWNATVNLSLLTESMHSARVYANDSVGNINNSQYVTFLVNRTNQVDAGGGNGGGNGGAGGGGGGGGGTSRAAEAVAEVECQSDAECGNDEYCAGNECHEYLCRSDNDCRPGLYCVDYACTRVFDLKIIDLVVNPGEIDFTYGMKNIFGQAGDVTLIHSIVDKEGKGITSGSDVIFVGDEDVIEQATLFFPPKMVPGEYRLSIQLTYKNYEVTSYRTFHVAAEEVVAPPAVAEEKISSPNIFGQALGAAGSLWKFLQSYLWLLLVSIIVVVAGGVIAAKTRPKKSDLELLEPWIRKALAQGKSKEDIHALLEQHNWPELKIHLAMERAQAVRSLQQKYTLSVSQIDETTRFIRKSARQGVSQADTILSLQEQGWDEKLIEQLVIAYYVG